jgi:hypothetical protein
VLAPAELEPAPALAPLPPPAAKAGPNEVPASNAAAINVRNRFRILRLLSWAGEFALSLLMTAPMTNPLM